MTHIHTGWRILLSAVVAMLVISGSVHASPRCAPRSELKSRLLERYREEVQSIGMIPGRGVVELFTSVSGSWTFVLTRPDGVGCIIASGQNWETLQQLTPPDRDARLDDRFAPTGRSGRL